MGPTTATTALAPFRASRFTALLLSVLAVCPLLATADIVFVEPSATYLPSSAPAACVNVLTRNITTCDSSITVPNTGVSYTLDTLSVTCDPACRSSLLTYISDISAQCPSGLTYATPENFPLEAYAEMAIYNFDTTCVQTSSGGSQYCQLVLQQLLNSTALDDPNAADPRCSECFVKLFQAKLNGGVWGYSEAQETAYSRLLSSCSIPATSYLITYTPPPSTTTTTAPGGADPTPAPRCPDEDATYTVLASDTCASIALAHSVATDSLLALNQLDAECRGLVAGSKLCMPAPCMTRLVATNDTCASILTELKLEIDSLPRLVSWNVAINNECSNLGGMVGKYICVTPPGTTTMPAPDPAKPQITQAPIPSNAHPDSNTYCGHWHTVTTGDTCATISITYNIRLKDFYFLNPHVTSGCLNLMTGVAYCVKPVGTLNTYTGYNPYTQGITFTQTMNVNATATPYNYTKTYRFTEPFYGAMPNTTVAPAPDYATMTATYTLCPPWEEMPFNTTEYDDGELPEAAYQNEEWMSEYSRVCMPDWSKPLPTEPAKFPPLDFGETTTTTTETTATTTGGPVPPGPTREGMVADCVKFHLAVVGDTCYDIAAAAGISIDDFYAWNPAVGNNCAALWPDYAYCVGRPTPTVTTSTGTSTTPTGVVPPGLTREGTATNCNGYHLAVAGDGCWSIANAAGISLDNFYAWNPAVGTDCASLWPNYAYCISVSSSTPTTSPTGRATAAPPGPTQSGASTKCVQWHLIASGEVCWDVVTKYGLTVEEFVALNPMLDESCAVWGGYAYCVEE